MKTLFWIIFGFAIGTLVSWINQGKDSGGDFIITIIPGILYSVIGGWIGILFGFNKLNNFNLEKFIIAIIGALIILFIYRKIRG